MFCHYCKKEKEKLCKAHIIPEAFFRFMYPDGKVEGDSLIMLVENRDYRSERRVGFYDTSILCAECDNLLGKKFDEYGKKILLDTEPKFVKGTELGEMLFFENTDPKRLKLFFLSVLWRFSISNLPELKKYKLPEKFENNLLSLLQSEDDGDVNTFSVLICRFDYHDKGKNFQKFMHSPVKTRIDGINYVNIYFPNGYKVLIKIDSRPQFYGLLPITLTNKGPVYIIRYEKFEETPEFRKLLETSSRIKFKGKI